MKVFFFFNNIFSCKTKKKLGIFNNIDENLDTSWELQRNRKVVKKLRPRHETGTKFKKKIREIDRGAKRDKNII